MIVFALRHADRTPEPQDGLTAKGVARAKLLARILGDSGVATAFCSKAERAKLTLQPLEQLLGNRIRHVKATEVDEIVSGVQGLPKDAVAVVVGHSDTVPEAIARLIGKAVDPIGDSEFDKLFVLAIGDGASSVALMRYGELT